jgi:hypothetical protein
VVAVALVAAVQAMPLFTKEDGHRRVDTQWRFDPNTKAKHGDHYHLPRVHP